MIQKGENMREYEVFLDKISFSYGDEEVSADEGQNSSPRYTPSGDVGLQLCHLPSGRRETEVL